MLCLIQDVNVLEQEKIDKLMLDMDGTENKCKIPVYFTIFCEDTCINKNIFKDIFGKYWAVHRTILNSISAPVMVICL